MDYVVALDAFEGPLDLLLHLVKQSNIDIFDINLFDITKQYLDYINKIEQMNLNIASEYLVMAAELIELKSRTLLPKNNDLEDEIEDDPRMELINKLVEYKAYKEAAPIFHRLEEDRKEYYTKDPSLEITGLDLSPKISSDIDLNSLMDALSKLLEKKELDKPLKTKITNKEYSVSKRSREIKEFLKLKKRVKFEELFDTYEKDYIVVTFLSILTLVKNGEVIIDQNNNFEEFYISMKV